MPSDATPHPNSLVITQALEEAAAGTPSLSNPMQLFSRGNVSNLAPSSPQRTDEVNGNTSLAGSARPLPSSVERNSPRRKRVTSSPRRAVAHDEFLERGNRFLSERNSPRRKRVTSSPRRAVAHDEFLEHGNCFLSEFPNASVNVDLHCIN